MIKQVHETALPGVRVIHAEVNVDERGGFLDAYEEEVYEAIGIKEKFIKSSFSWSRRGVLRGLHHQLDKPQAKMCTVINGDILDVVADIRFGSPTYGRHITQPLSSDGINTIYIPAGYSHGLLALSDDVIFAYLCTAKYSGISDQRGVRWNDPDLNIQWGISDPNLSAKDRELPFLKDILPELLPK